MALYTIGVYKNKEGGGIYLAWYEYKVFETVEDGQAYCKSKNNSELSYILFH